MSGDESDCDGTVRRRSVLAALGGTAAAGTGIVGVSEPGSAKSNDRRSALGALLAEQRVKSIRKEFGNVEKVRRTFDEHASDILGDLSDRNLITEASISEFNVDATSSADLSAETDEGPTVTGIEVNDELTPHIYASTSTETHEISIFVQPEVERAYAIVEPTDSGGGFVLDAMSGEVEPNGFCTTETYCSGCCCSNGLCCSTQHVYERKCCTDSDGNTTCYDGERTGGCCDA